MSAAKIIAQGAQLQIFGLDQTVFRLPVLLHARVQMTGGAPVLVFGRDATSLVAGTTVDTTVVLSAAGTFDFTFNPCRSFALGTFTFVYLPTALFTEKREAVVDQLSANTNAGTGKLRIGTNNTSAGTAVASTPPNGSEFHISLWADLG